MDDCRKERLRANLLGMRRAYYDQLRRLRHGIAAANDKRTVGDITDDVQFEMDRGIAADLMANLNANIERIDDALTRMAAGIYGKCAVCDGDIAEKRLAAIPFAVTCIGCHTSLEAEAARSRHHPVYELSKSA
jgi:DnaK suppressor protein